jgi:hypothetical protein
VPWRRRSTWFWCRSWRRATSSRRWTWRARHRRADAAYRRAEQGRPGPRRAGGPRRRRNRARLPWARSRPAGGLREHGHDGRPVADRQVLRRHVAARRTCGPCRGCRTVSSPTRAARGRPASRGGSASRCSCSTAPPRTISSRCASLPRTTASPTPATSSRSRCPASLCARW